MQAYYVQDERAVDYTPSAKVEAGSVVVLGAIVGVAHQEIQAHERGALTVAGIFDFKSAGDSVTAGAAIFWDSTGVPVGGSAGTGAATTTGGGNTFIGFAVLAAEATDLYVRVSLKNSTATVQDLAKTTAITGSTTSLSISGQAGAPGGKVALAGGAGTESNAAGGDIELDGGKADGSGDDGTVKIGTTRGAVVLGKASTPINLAGIAALSVGASTTAAGSSESNAGALPEGTASVYPTTAADGDTGVIVDVADKVDGRVLFIANGVPDKVLNIYPPAGGTINGATADAAFETASGKGAILVCLSADTNAWAAW